MKIKAFNLSEVLIALTIITVVGVLTISTVTTNFKKASYVAGLKEADRLISDAAGLIMKDNGGSMVGAFSDANDMMNKFAEKLLPTKTCAAGLDINGCWHNEAVDFKMLDNSIGSYDPDDDPRMLLRNGMLLGFSLNSSQCNNDLYKVNGIDSACGEVLVDVNGFEKPNKYGRDIFVIGIYNQGTFISGEDGSYVSNATVYCNPASNDQWSGWGCAGKIINEGGMNY